jgi:hypothetical protein
MLGVFHKWTYGDICTRDFFIKKLRARGSNCTSRAEAKRNHTQTTMRTNAQNKTLQHHSLGQEPTVSHRNPHRHHQCCATPKAATRWLLQGQVATWTPPPWANTNKPHIHDRRSLYSVLRHSIGRTLSSQSILTTLRGGLTSSTTSHSYAKNSDIWNYFESNTSAQLSPRSPLHQARQPEATHPWTLSPPCQHGSSAPPQPQHTRQHHQPTTTSTGRDGSPDAAPPRRAARQRRRRRTSIEDWVFTQGSPCTREKWDST